MADAAPLIGIHGRPERAHSRGTSRPGGRDAPPGAVRRSRTTGADRRDRTVPGLVALALALVVAFVVAPATVAGGTYGRSVSGDGPLVGATRTGLVQLWDSGRADLPPTLRSAVDYWARYHGVKAVISALLAVVLLVLALRVWRTLGRPDERGRHRTAALTSAFVGLLVLELLAIALVMANVQGAIAPLTSVLSLLGPEQRVGDAGAVVAQIRQALGSAAGSSDGPHAMALEAMVDDFSRYHAALAVMGGAVVAVLVAVGTMARRAPSATGPSTARSRRVLRVVGVWAFVLALLMAVVVAANVSNATAPEHGLRIFFGGA